MNENFTDFFESAMERTVTIGGPDGSPAITVKLLHAALAAAAAVFFAPRATAIGAFAALLRGVSVTIDKSAPESL